MKNTTIEEMYQHHLKEYPETSRDDFYLGFFAAYDLMTLQIERMPSHDVQFLLDNIGNELRKHYLKKKLTLN